MSDGVPLAAAIESLRDELEQAMDAGKDRALKFRAEAVELTLQTQVTTAGKGTAGIKWWLVQAGAEASRQSQATQTVVLKLTPTALQSDGTRGPVDLDGKD